MIKEYRSKLVKILDSISGEDREIGNNLSEDSFDVLGRLQKKGYLDHKYQITSKGETFRVKMHEKQEYRTNGPRGKREYARLFDYWAETVRDLAESSEASQRNIDYGLRINC